MPQLPPPRPQRRSRRERRREKRARRSASAIAEGNHQARAQGAAGQRPTVEYLPTWELDVDAMSRRDTLDDRVVDPFGLVDQYVDWLAGNQARTPQRRAGLAHWRATNTERALQHEHDTCQFGDFWCWSRRAGAREAYLACNGCVYSYPQPTAPDLSLRDAFGELDTPRAIEQHEQLLVRMARLRRGLR